jgi:hypothetical protein
VNRTDRKTLECGLLVVLFALAVLGIIWACM